MNLNLFSLPSAKYLLWSAAAALGSLIFTSRLLPILLKSNYFPSGVLIMPSIAEIAAVFLVALFALWITCGLICGCAKTGKATKWRLMGELALPAISGGVFAFIYKLSSVKETIQLLPLGASISVNSLAADLSFAFWAGVVIACFLSIGLRRLFFKEG